MLDWDSALLTYKNGKTLVSWHVNVLDAAFCVMFVQDMISCPRVSY